MMTGYELSRAWFDFCFENPEKISPNHTAIYFFAIEHCNRLGWKEKFGFPSQMTMDALGIKKHQTYIKYFNDIVNWGGFTLIQKSKNQYSANIITINAMPENGKALDKALITHAAKQTESNGQSTGQSNSSINKQYNNITINNKQEETCVYELSENDIKLQKFLSEKFNISELTQPGHFMTLTNAIIFMGNQPEEINRHFRDQCFYYFKYKEAADEKRHNSIDSFLFDDSKDGYKDRLMSGGWNKSNWLALGKKMFESKWTKLLEK